MATGSQNSDTGMDTGSQDSDTRMVTGSQDSVDNVDSRDPMLRILSDLGMGNLFETFETNKVGPSEVGILSAEEFQCLGIVAIGDRARLKQACKDFLKGKSTETQSSVRGSRKRKLKETRRVHVGWKHRRIRGNQSVLVHPSKGGGTNKIDLNRSCSLQQLKEYLCDIYLPGGQCASNGLTLDAIQCRVSTFSGNHLPETIKGVPFTLGAYCDSVPNNPVRVYLESEELPDVQAPTVQQEDPLQMPQEDPMQMPQVEPLQMPQEEPLQQQEPPPDTFEEAGTPSVLIERNLPMRGQRPAQRALHNPRQIQEDEIVPQLDYDIHDSEDEALERAIEASLQEQRNRPSTSQPDRTLQEILEEVKSRIGTGRQEVIVSRLHVMDSAFRALRRPIDISKSLYIKFSGEMGLDHGGPRREFFRLSMQEINASSLFEGKASAKLFSHDIPRLANEDYKLAGKLVGLSIAHGCSGFHFLDETLARLMLGMEPDYHAFDLDGLPNVMAKDILLQLKRIEQLQDVERFLTEHGDWMADQGYHGWRMKVEDKGKVYESLLKQLIFYRTSAEISQFTSGMEEVFGLWTVMKTHPGTCLPLLSKKSAPLAKQDFMDLFETVYSEQGSNQRRQEEETIHSWEIFLQEIEDKTIDVTYEEVLEFVSGADQIPPCGFQSKIEITFYTYEQDNKRLPFSSTCSLTLSIPRGIAQPDEFRAVMTRSLRESQGFGKI